MIGDKFGSALVFASGSISAGFTFKYQNSESTTNASDIGLGVSLGPLPGTLTAPATYTAYDKYSVLTYQLAPDPIYQQWLYDDLGPNSQFLQSLAPNAQPWKIVYLVKGETVNGSQIPAPVLDAWSGNLGDAGECPNPPWVSGFNVRYAVSFYGGSDPNNPDWESPEGPWTQWLSSTAYCRGILTPIPLAPASWSDPNGIGRKIYRQFLGSSPEYIGNIADNTTQEFVDPVGQAQAASSG